MSQGGARKGAGRPVGKNWVMTNFSLSRPTVTELNRQVPRGQRSKFVEAAIQRALSLS